MSEFIDRTHRYNFNPQDSPAVDYREVLARHGFLDQYGNIPDSVPHYEMYGRAILSLVVDNE